ncbi:MAG: acetate--CoA ligase family protein [Nannocystis sp.]|nr:acetate--CoA ligase family protein [Nannocystis sp.]
MEALPGLDAALAAILAPARHRAAIVIADEVASAHIDIPGAERAAARELARRLNAGERPAVVVVEHTSPPLLRALFNAPPALLILTGDSPPGALPQGIALLGPRARLVVDAGDQIITAPDPHTLHKLIEALGSARLRLALSPTPPWLPRWLADAALSDAAAIGLVDAAVLDRAWAEWIRAQPLDRATRHVLVPLGVAAPRVDQPRHPSLDAIVAAHTFERTSGPIFPAPEVIAAIVAGRSAPSTAAPPTPGQRALWAQARRSLPFSGAAAGMEDPIEGLSLDDPPAAFLAQRALLRRQRGLDLALAAAPDRPAPSEHLIERSLEVLRGAGEVLSEHESKVVLRGLEVEVTRQAVASSASGAASFAEQIGFPVVLKALCPGLRRKQEIGAVHLDLVNGAAVRRAYATILANIEHNAPTAHLDGVLVAEQVPPGLEIHCGLIRLASGPLALFGAPVGLAAPVEHVLAPCPLSPAEALLLAHAVLSMIPLPALRRRSDPDVHTLAGLFSCLDGLARATGDRLLVVDLNPIRLIGAPRGYVTLDARIVQRPHLEGL